MRVKLLRLVLGSALIWLSDSAIAAELKWETRLYGRAAALAFSVEGKPGFTLMPASETGVYFTNILSDARAAENQIRLNGSGVALGDVDSDGWCDI